MTFLSYRNKAAATATTASASSSQLAWPVRRVKDQSPGRSWRGATGWTVVAGFNDRIDLDVPAVPAATDATIAAGNYATAAEYAAAVEAALETETGDAWTVSYSAGTFTISRANAFVLEFGTGANLATSAARDLGFAASDTVSGTSAAGTAEVFKSRQYVGLDLGSTQDVTFAAVAASPDRLSGSITVKGSGTSVLAAATSAALATLAGDSRQRFYSFGSPQSFRYWAIVVDDCENDVASHVEVGVVWLGEKFTPAGGIATGLGFAAEPLDGLAFSASGSHFQFRRTERRAIACEFRMNDTTDRDSWITMRETLGAGGNFWLVIVDPTTGSRVVYGFVDSLPAPAHDAESYNYWTVPLYVREAL